MGKRYEVVCYMRINEEEPERYDTLEEAEEVVDSLEAMNQDDIYKIEEV